MPPTEFWFPDNLPSEEDVRRHREQAEVEHEEPVSGDAHRPTADAYTGALVAGGPAPAAVHAGPTGPGGPRAEEDR